MQMVSQELDEIFGGLARSSRGGSISFSYKKPQPFHPRPLPGIDEEQLVRIRTCTGCQNNYAGLRGTPILPRVWAAPGSVGRLR